MVSRRVSATGTSLLGHPIPARELGPPHGRLTEHAHRHARTLTGLPRSARTSCDRGGCPLCPEDGGAHPELKRVLSRRLPFHHGQSLNPATTSHHARLCFTRHQTGVHVVHPPGLPLACDPPDGTRAPWAFPRASHPADQEPDNARRGGDRPSSTDLELPLNSHPSISNPVVHSCRATSRRTAQRTSLIGLTGVPSQRAMQVPAT